MTELVITPLMLTSASSKWSQQNQELTAAVDKLNGLSGNGFGEAVAARLELFASEWSTSTKDTSQRAQAMADHLNDVQASFDELDEECSTSISQHDPATDAKCRTATPTHGTLRVGTSTVNTGTAWNTEAAQRFADWLEGP